ncbi:MAG: multidrug effflux MFS transporter, partial [Rubricella sp.]
PPHLVTLIFVTSLAIVTLNLFAPSLAGMAADFGVSFATIGWSISGYFLLTAVLQILIGPLSDRIGRRPVLLAGLAIFTAASLGCVLAGDVGWFLFFRVLQAAIASGMVLSAAIVRDTVPGPEAARRLGIIGAAIAIAPMVGPTVGGLLDTAFGWRANFVLYAVLGLAGLILVWADLGETNPHKGRPMAAQLRAYPALIGSLRFWINCLCAAFSVSVFYVFTVAAPLVARDVFGVSSLAVGLAMATTPLGFLIGNVLTARLVRRFGQGRLMIYGRLTTVLGMAAVLALSLVPDTSPLPYFGLMITVGIGNGLTLPNANANALGVRPDLAGTAAGLFGATNVLLGAITTIAAGRLIPGAAPDVALAGAMLLLSVTAFALALVARRLEPPPP